MSASSTRYEPSDDSRLAQLRQLLCTVAIRLALPIFLVFWIVDCLYVPDRKWEFLGIRLVAIPLCLGVHRLLTRPLTRLWVAEAIAIFFVFVASLMVTAMGFLSGGINSLYFEGLNLIALASVPFFPLRRPALALIIAAIYSPFALSCWLVFDVPGEAREFFVYSAMMISTVVICLVLRTITARLRANELRAELRLGELARQVAHDIRSPLTALKLAVGEIPGIPEESRSLVRSALLRIEDIANDLLGRHTLGETHPSEQPRAEWLNPIIEAILSEKRIQYRNRPEVAIQSTVGPSSYGCFALVVSTELKRVLSNLVDNAVQALDRPGTVSVSLSLADREATLTVADDGKGISPELLPRLGKETLSYGKWGGNGLGLRHARESATSWGGSLEIDSTLGRGTRVTLRLRRCAPPAWFLSSMAVRRNVPLVVVDDEPFVHAVWDARAQCVPGASFHHLYSLSQLKRWRAADDKSDCLLLLDHEFRDSRETGLDAIASLGLQGRAVLVTNRHEDPDLQARCDVLGVKLLPKTMVPFVPIDSIE